MSVFGNPETQVAFSIFENKGVFALLLGSGLSRAAEIPTGWEITTDLVRRVATAEGVEDQADWAQWYQEKHGKEPNYSELLGQLASTPAERRSILHSYIEPNEDDRAEGRKLPTAGHKAIAQLVQEGFVKVIVTTNFDRLMENALREVGVEPTIVSSEDALKGAEPLAHTDCYILKLHGDYKDARILNTEEELNGYPAPYDVLLDRILDEYGLIVCGWSGEWDHALRAAILRAPNRRYPMFWATRGALRDKGKELCDHRKGIQIPIADADKFFSALSEQVRTLTDSRKRNPADVDMLVARAKRYLSSRANIIQLADLVDDEVRKTIATLESHSLTAHGPFKAEDFQRRVVLYEAAAEGIAKICGLIGRWGTLDQAGLVIEAIRSLVDYGEANSGGLVAYTKLRRYPAVLVYQATALGFVKAGKWREFRDFLVIEIDTGFDGRMRVSDAVFPVTWAGRDREIWNHLKGYERRYVPLCDHLFDNVFSKWGSSFMGSMSGFSTNFLLSEILVSFVTLDILTREQIETKLNDATQGSARNFHWMPIGRAGYDREFRSNIKAMFDTNAFLHDLAQAGFGHGNVEEIQLLFENYSRCSSDRRMW